jgi:hypothetical protein
MTHVGQFPVINPLTTPQVTTAVMKEMGQKPTAMPSMPFSFLAPVQQKAVDVKDWFKDPAWAGGPPRWQVTLAGSGVAVAVGVVLYGFLKK